MEKTINYLNKNYPEIFTIADAKRGDIGNTSKMYADALKLFRQYLLVKRKSSTILRKDNITKTS